jgi:hypothetical protein
VLCECGVLALIALAGLLGAAVAVLLLFALAECGGGAACPHPDRSAPPSRLDTLCRACSKLGLAPLLLAGALCEEIELGQQKVRNPAHEGDGAVSGDERNRQQVQRG